MSKELPLIFHGCSENNLKNIDLELPAESLIAITGLSGSGKSSLAFHTIYAEGQRRYIETFSPYTRQFLDKLKKPELLYSEHMRPALAIQQKTKIRSSRSTVGSMTHAKELLKSIWPHLAELYCPITNKRLRRWPAETLAAKLEKKAADATIYIAAHIELGKTNKKKEEAISDLLAQGFSRFMDPETFVRFKADTTDKLPSSVYILFDRVGKNFRLKQVKDSIEQAYQIAHGSCSIIVETKEKKYKVEDYSLHFKLSDGTILRKAKASQFDHNSPVGACPKCRGFGKSLEIDAEKIIENPKLSLEEDAISCWKSENRAHLKNRMLAFAEDNEIPTDVPWKKLTKVQKALLLYDRSRHFRGAIPWLHSLERKSYKMHVRVFLSRFRSEKTCSECNGKRLKPESLYFKIEDKNIAEVWDLSISEMLSWLNCVKDKHENKINASLELHDTFSNLYERLRALVNLGLPYVSLNRQAKTLSGGETQRVNLVTALGSELVSSTFVLDEPSVGLHPRDSDRLLSELQKLRNRGNNVIVVEHDLDFIYSANHVLELGPEAGSHGGEISYFGKQKSWPGIDTGVFNKSKEPSFQKSIEIKNASSRNLKDFTCKIPIGSFTTLCGVSGSGKSTLVEEVILKAHKEGSSKIVKGLSHFADVLLIDQSSLAKSPRANIATYSGIWETLRKQLAKTGKAQAKMLTASSFSFNVDGGRCPHCKGAGYLKEDMQFLSDAYVLCEECLGERFQQTVLDVTYLGKSVSEWLHTTIADCAELLFDDKKVANIAETLKALGLGHLRLGHTLSELSGGEAQRLKLIPFLEKASKKKCLLIFDEPTTGLHFYDVQKLVSIFNNLTEKGHTVLCIEHNQEVLLAADYLLDLGPEGGDGGGTLVLEGAPEAFLSKKAAKNSHTARFLQDYVKRYKSKETKKEAHKFKDQKSKSSKALFIKGAREHNLKNVDVTLPHNKLIAFTGVSGSGKSSIAKDIVYAEGQRRYLDCLSPYARQFIRELKKPKIDSIENVRPSICVEQHSTQVGKRATLATVSEVYSFLRLLYAKAGSQFCPEHPTQEVVALSADKVADRIKEFDNKTVRLIAPIITKRKGEHKDVFRRARQADIAEVRVNDVFGPVAAFEGELERHKVHSIDFVWGKFIPKRLPKKMLVEAVEEVFALSAGSIVVNSDDKDSIFSRERACPDCGRGFFRPDPEDLSFLSARGRCGTCDGTGVNEKGNDCKKCGGSKLKEKGQFVRIDGKNISDACRLSANELETWLAKAMFEEHLKPLTTPLIEEIFNRLTTLKELGLGYLPLDRSVLNIASGELQRLRLAAALGSPLTGAMYIFDEPSAGLHPNDNEHVLLKLRELQQQGNTVLLIEHDPESILSADYIIEMGPGGGSEGGEIVFEGDCKKFTKLKRHLVKESYTPSRKKKAENFLHVSKGNINNLENFKAKIPLQEYVCIAGVSGAGKSSFVDGLILQTLDIVQRATNTNFKSSYAHITSDISIDRLLCVDQSPIGKNSRSTPVSYLKIWDEIRKLFAKTIEARTHGWNAGYFSYNGGKGACPECKGLGEIKLDINFLNQARVECEYCQGERYKEDTLRARYAGLTINDVLHLTFNEAKSVFANHKKIHKAIHQACELGLGYITLGQSAPTLSGGESQRLKLVLELAKVPRGHTLYIFDEPTRGLHRKDVMLLINVFKSLTEQGHSVIVIEHDEDVIRAADELIEIGPGAGEAGGKIVYQGRPSRIKKSTAWGKRLKQPPSP